jgi:hypothetical protein
MWFSFLVDWGQGAYTSDLRYPHRKDSGAVRSGQYDGQGMLPNCEIEQPGNIPVRNVMLYLAT